MCCYDVLAVLLAVSTIHILIAALTGILTGILTGRDRSVTS